MKKNEEHHYTPRVSILYLSQFSHFSFLYSISFKIRNTFRDLASKFPFNSLTKYFTILNILFLLRSNVEFILFLVLLKILVTLAEQGESLKIEFTSTVQKQEMMVFRSYLLSIVCLIIVILAVQILEQCLLLFFLLT